MLKSDHFDFEFRFAFDHKNYVIPEDLQPSYLKYTKVLKGCFSFSPFSVPLRIGYFTALLLTYPAELPVLVHMGTSMSTIKDGYAPPSVF